VFWVFVWGEVASGFCLWLVRLLVFGWFGSWFVLLCRLFCGGAFSELVWDGLFAGGLTLILFWSFWVGCLGFCCLGLVMVFLSVFGGVGGFCWSLIWV